MLERLKSWLRFIWWRLRGFRQDYHLSYDYLKGRRILLNWLARLAFGSYGIAYGPVNAFPRNLERQLKWNLSKDLKTKLDLFLGRLEDSLKRENNLRHPKPVTQPKLVRKHIRGMLLDLKPAAAHGTAVGPINGLRAGPEVHVAKQNPGPFSMRFCRIMRLEDVRQGLLSDSYGSRYNASDCQLFKDLMSERILEGTFPGEDPTAVNWITDYEELCRRIGWPSGSPFSKKIGSSLSFFNFAGEMVTCSDSKVGSLSDKANHARNLLGLSHHDGGTCAVILRFPHDCNLEATKPTLLDTGGLAPFRVADTNEDFGRAVNLDNGHEDLVELITGPIRIELEEEFRVEPLGKVGAVPSDWLNNFRLHH